MSFETFRRRANSAKIAETIIKSQEKKSFDDGSWKIQPDKDTGIAKATIRFLPAKEGDLPYELIYSHFFKGDDGNWCIVERCNRSFNEPCEICEKNRQLYNTGKESDKEIARKRKAKKTYIFNILVVDEPAHPENNGKVFVFKCGPAIFQMICDAMNSQFGEEPKRPFDLDSGHNFHIRVRNDATKSNLPNYDKSVFADEATPAASSDAELERIYNEMVNLKEFANRGRKSDSEIHKLAERAYCSCLPSADFSSSSNGATTSTSNVFEPEPKGTNIDDIPWDTPAQPSESVEDTKAFFASLIEE